MHRNQSINNIAANDGQVKLTIYDVWTIFQYKYWKIQKKKFLTWSIEGDAGGA